MRVCIFVRQMYPVIAGWSEGFGGAEIEMYNVSRALARRPDVDVTVAALVEEGPMQPFSHEGMTVLPVPYRKISDPSHGRAKREWLRAQHGWRVMRLLAGVRADAYVTKLASYEFPFIRLATRMVRRPLVYRFASDLETTVESLTDRIFGGRAFWARQFISTLRKCDAVMAQTEVQKGLIRANYGIDATVIGNAHEMPEHIPAFGDRDLVLWVGRCHPWKRADLYLDLAERLPDQKFVMIAPGLKDHEALFRDTRDRAATLPNVTFSAGVAPSEMAQWYERARVFVMTSEVEGFPNVMIESLKHGAPVVSLHLNPDHVLSQDAAPACGYFFPAFGDGFVERVKRLAADAPLWEACSGMAVTLARGRFAADAVAEQYVRLISPLVEGRRGR